MLLFALSVPLMMAFSFLLDGGSPDDNDPPPTEDDDLLADKEFVHGATLSFYEESPPDAEPDAATADDGHDRDFPGGADASEDDADADLADDSAPAEQVADASPSDSSQSDASLPGGSDDSEDHAFDDTPTEPAADHALPGGSEDSEADPLAALAPGEGFVDDPLADPAAEADNATPESPALWSAGDPPVSIDGFDPAKDQIAIDLADPQASLTTIGSADGADTEVQLDGQTILILRGISPADLPDDAITSVPGLTEL